MNILYINATIKPNSRTNRLAQRVLGKLDGHIKEIVLTEENIPPLDFATLEHRTSMINEYNFEDPIFYYAREYASADTIVIAAPYWDLSFPAVLKNYIENINIPELVFKYGEDEKPIGLCNAKDLIYITTAGGKITSDEYGYGYIKELAQKFHGIKNVHYISAEKLDMRDSNIEEILQKAENKIDKMFKSENINE